MSPRDTAPLSPGPLPVLSATPASAKEVSSSLTDSVPSDSVPHSLLAALRSLDDTLGTFARVIWATPHFAIFNVLFAYLALPQGARLPSAPLLLVNYAITTTLIGLAMSVCLHRYFSHGAFKTSRTITFLLALFSTLACQRGPIWWASKHIRHHAHCDGEKDPHSPVTRSKFDTVAMWGSRESPVDWAFVPTRLQLPELYLVDTFFFIPPLLYFLAIYYLSGQSNYALLYYGLNPHFFCVLITSIFNARYHDIEETISSTSCKGVDRVSDLMANLVGENLHMEHHRFPRLAQRHKADMPYWAMIYPMKRMGVIWDVDYNGVATACQRHPDKGRGAMGVVEVDDTRRANEQVPFGFTDVYWGAIFTSLFEVLIGCCAVYALYQAVTSPTTLQTFARAVNPPTARIEL